jgi:hypothetical protein
MNVLIIYLYYIFRNYLFIYFKNLKLVMTELSDSNFNDNHSTTSPSSGAASNATSGVSGTPNSSSTTTTTTTATTSQSVAEVGAFINYLKQFVPALLDANLTSLSDFEKCLNEKTSLETIKKFLGETQIRTLIIQKFIIKGILFSIKCLFYFKIYFRFR